MIHVLIIFTILIVIWVPILCILWYFKYIYSNQVKDVYDILSIKIKEYINVHKNILTILTWYDRKVFLELHNTITNSIEHTYGGINHNVSGFITTCQDALNLTLKSATINLPILKDQTMINYCEKEDNVDFYTLLHELGHFNDYLTKHKSNEYSANKWIIEFLINNLNRNQLSLIYSNIKFEITRQTNIEDHYKYKLLNYIKDYNIINPFYVIEEVFKYIIRSIYEKRN